MTTKSFNYLSEKIWPKEFIKWKGHYGAIFFGSVTIVIVVIFLGAGIMMALDGLSFVSAFYFAAQTSVVRLSLDRNIHFLLLPY
jgi:hypothetical protein